MAQAGNGARRSRLHAVLYSGGQETRNALIHDSLLRLAMLRPAGGLRPSEGVRMTYLPYTREGSGAFYERFQRRYRAFGARHFECVAVDDPALFQQPLARERARRTLLRSDVVYLAGGNTFTFLHHLRRAGLLGVLRRFAERGGVLAGLSAGAILMTPHIGLAAWPPFDRDENDVALPRSRWRALGIVGFEFFPHFRASRRYCAALRAYSARSRRAIYACRDGSGLVVVGDRFTAHGDVWLFDRGRERRVGT